MLVKNPTHYFNDYTRIYNVVPDTGTFSFESDKRLSYYQRLYYELLYTQKVNGRAFFFTLTYCDAKIPKFLGRNVHSYADVRKLVNGSISKVLLREYGSRLRYFCACECGEGGTEQHHARGLGNNPHYHFIFFVQPVHDKNNLPVYDDYKRISVLAFTRLLRAFWLGKEEGYFNYKFANYGVIKEGSLGAEVKTPEAFGYVIKYVIKDIESKKTDSIVYNHYYNQCLEGACQSKLAFYNYYLELKYHYSCRRDIFWKKFQLSDYVWQRRNHITSLSLFDWFAQVGTEYTKGEVKKYYDWFEKVYCPSYAKYKLAQFNNEYGPKVRLSNGLGEYGLNFIHDINFCPRFHINYCGQIQSQSPALYYIRKLYYDTYKCPYTGNPLYRLNQRGIDLRVHQFSDLFFKTLDCVKESIAFANANDVVVPTRFDLLDYRRYLDGETSVITHTYGDNMKLAINTHDNIDYILNLFVAYRLVYQHRCYNTKLSMIALNSDFSIHDVESDYHYFLSHRASFLDYENCDIFALTEIHPDLISFSSFYVFFPFIEYFEYLESLCNCVQLIRDKAKQVKFAERAEESKKVKAYEYNIS